MRVKAQRYLRRALCLMLRFARLRRAMAHAFFACAMPRAAQEASPPAYTKAAESGAYCARYARCAAPARVIDSATALRGAPMRELFSGEALSRKDSEAQR